MGDDPEDRSGDESDDAVPAPDSAADQDLSPSQDATRQYDPETENRKNEKTEPEGGGSERRKAKGPRRLGKYTIQGKIGQGGMGIVWKGFDPDLHRTVAIKVLGSHLAHSARARRRFQREARAAAAINHPNVLTIHAVEEYNECPFLVMEFISGHSLKSYVAERGKLNAIEVIALSAQIAQGLSAAHTQGVIHRDVKPGNVMLHEGGTRVRLADFGLARAAFDNSELTSHDHAVGTPAYMAPEQVRGERIDARADLFSLGCVMYFMLVGYSPFQGRNQAETIHKILSTSIRPVSEVDATIPPVLGDIVDRLLQKNPDERYQSAFEVAEVLTRLLAQLNQAPTDEIVDMLSRSVAVAPKASERPRRRRFTLPVIGGTVSVVAIVVGAIAWSVWHGEPPKSASDSVVGTMASTTPLRPGADAMPARKLPAEKLTRIKVGSGADADFASIAQAVERAAENCTITVTGPGPYVESVDVHGESLRGLKLIAESRAVWRGESAGHTLAIGDVSGVVVQGFDFEVNAKKCRGIDVSGKVDTLTVVDCSFRHLLKSPGVSLITIASVSDDPDARVRIEKCRFVGEMHPANCLSIDGGSVPRVECEECQFSGPQTLVYVTDSCRQLRMKGNIFVGGNNAINLNLKAWSRDSRIEIVNNTFVDSKWWLGLMDSFRSDSLPAENSDSRVCNNLIIGGERVQGGEDQWEAVFRSWRFAANWWERSKLTRSTADWGGRLATMQTSLAIPIREDSNHSQFLVPSAESPLLTSGCGGDLPTYIGAKGPSDAR